MSETITGISSILKSWAGCGPGQPESRSAPGLTWIANFNGQLSLSTILNRLRVFVGGKGV